jgi:hypothetical protein
MGGSLDVDSRTGRNSSWIISIPSSSPSGADSALARPPGGGRLPIQS